MSEYIIREMRKSDLLEVIALENSIFKSNAWSLSQFFNELKFEYAKYWVLRLEVALVGYIGIYNLMGELEISNVAISEAYRGKGYSKILLEYVLKYAKQCEVNKIFLEVETSNTIAISLYERYGFVSLFIRRNYYGNGRDAYVMELKLMPEEENEIL